MKEVKYERMISTSGHEYHRHARRAFSSQNYFNTFRDLTLIIDVLPAVFLSDLISREDILTRRRFQLRKRGLNKKAAKVRIDKDDYFGCSTKFLQSRRYPPVWTVKQQRNQLAKLTKLGFIKTRRQGHDGIRWIWIDYERINIELDKIDGETNGDS